MVEPSSKENRSTPTPGDILRLTRTLKRESQSDVGSSIGLSTPAISLIESGNRRITSAVARKLGEHFFADGAESR